LENFFASREVPKKTRKVKLIVRDDTTIAATTAPQKVRKVKLIVHNDTATAADTSVGEGKGAAQD